MASEMKVGVGMAEMSLDWNGKKNALE